MLITIYRSGIGDKINLFEIETSSYSEIRDEVIDRVKAIAISLSDIHNAYSTQTNNTKIEHSKTIEIIQINIARITSKTSSKRANKICNKDLAGLDNYESTNICKYTFHVETEYIETENGEVKGGKVEAKKTATIKKGFAKW